jgi:diadenosine tetraphosphatase ApaH/serine/threonine PP2A family protein phosphatase
MWEQFCDAFDAMPIAAVLVGAYFSVHGGISPHLNRVRQTAAIAR